ncbi:hypothetical protein F4678DRAFT_459496 [Xylaria arbuscula]|nr:hypothetical protein F4678DRAFT_459496 [Xylaria arbuscula]
MSLSAFRRSPSRPHSVQQKMLLEHLTKILEKKIQQMLVKQCLIPYHVVLLDLGTWETRSSYHLLQDHYTNILGLSIGEIRPYIKHIGLDQLEGFSIKQIGSSESIFKELEENEDDENKMPNFDDDDDTANNHTGIELQQLENLPPSIEEPPPILTNHANLDELINKAHETLDALLQDYKDDEDGSNVQATQVAQQEPPDGELYDPDGFYNGGDDNDDTMTDIGFNIDSWIDWSGSDQEDEPNLGSSRLGEASSSVYQNSPEPPISPTQPPNVNITTPTSLVAESASKDKDKEIAEPSSENFSLRGLLTKLGVSSHISRTNKLLRLEGGDYSILNNGWDRKVTEYMIRQEQLPLHERDSYQQQLDSEEANHLDSWDTKNNQFVWQKEGYFLCRLAEMVLQPEFVTARLTRLSMEEKNWNKKINWAPRLISEGFGSPLRRSISPPP